MKDRDDRITTAPPPGVIERATESIPALASGVVGDSITDETTDPHATDYEKMQSRAHRAAVNSKVAAQNASAGLAETVALRERLAAIEGKLAILIPEYQAEKAALRQVTVVEKSARAEVDKADSLAKIADATEAKQLRRKLLGEFIQKYMTAIVGTAAAAAAAAVTALLSRC